MSSTIGWKKYLNETIITFRAKFRRLPSSHQSQIRQKALSHSFFTPVQVEALLFEAGKIAVWFIVHDKHLPDMMFKIHENARSISESEFLKKYPNLRKQSVFLPKWLSLGTAEPNPKARGRIMYFVWEETHHTFLGNFHPQTVASIVLSDVNEAIKSEQVDVIEKSTKGLRKSITKIREENIRNDLLSATKKIDQSLQKIKRLDEEISKVKQQVGVSQEYQDWKLLVSDVDRIKGEHVPREVLEAKVNELNTRIDSLAGIKEAYDKIFAQQNQFMKQQSDVMKQQSSFINWIKYSTILVPIVVACVPIIETLFRHFLDTV